MKGRMNVKIVKATIRAKARYIMLLAVLASEPKTMGKGPIRITPPPFPLPPAKAKIKATIRTAKPASISINPTEVSHSQANVHQIGT